MNEGYNPEFNPTGIEGGIDTNALPWIELSQASGMAIKPLRASIETGVFTVVVHGRQGRACVGRWCLEPGRRREVIAKSNEEARIGKCHV